MREECLPIDTRPVLITCSAGMRLIFNMYLTNKKGRESESQRDLHLEVSCAEEQVDD